MDFVVTLNSTLTKQFHCLLYYASILNVLESTSLANYPSFSSRFVRSKVSRV
jgi:hypothetical protein